MWYTDFGFWCTVIGLAVCVGYLFLARSWWRGTWSASKIRWRDRAWLTAVIGLTALLVATIYLKFLESYDVGPKWMWGIGMALMFAGLLLIAFAPLVGWWSLLDFMVPRRLRSATDTPDQWAEAKTLAHGNRQERRAKRQGRG
jgi:hypothetical protein